MIVFRGLDTQKSTAQAGRLMRCLFVSFGVVGQTEDVVHRYLVKIGQADEHIRGDVPLAQLVVAVDALGTIQNFCKLSLLQISIFSQITNPLVHSTTLS